MKLFSHRGRQARAVGVGAAVGAFTLASVSIPVATAFASPGGPHRPHYIQLTPEGLKPGAIKHVWLIILENKSYDATFSGLNSNSYLWKTLPSQGVLLKNYYGTGHFSMDNYISLVTGQAPNQDTQEDCSTVDRLLNTNAGIDTTGNVRTNPNYGQVLSHSGANAPLGSNGCSYPTAVPTLFNQFNAAGVSWKGYAQDLGGEQNYLQHPFTPFQAETVPGREDAVCAGPGTVANNPNTDPANLVAPPSGDIASYTGAQSVSFGGTDYIDQYVAKHFPVGWFESLTGQINPSGPATPALNEPRTDLPGEGNGRPTNCDPSHVANLDSPTDGLVHDLRSEATTPAFSWITPDNCSDAHDAVCKGNNLSGAFNPDGTPNYEIGTPYAYDPETIPPKNYTGGLYAADLFLEYYIPLIEQSPAFRDGGLIDITFDEGFAPFTYTGNSFNDGPTTGPGVPTYGRPGTTAPGADSVYGAYDIQSDQAAENLFGRNVHTEPTGPNSTLATNSAGDQLYPGPGNNAFIDRPPACTSASTPPGCVAGIVEGGAGTPPGPRTDSAATGGPTTSYIVDPSIVSDDTGRIVTGTNIPPNSFVGTVINQGPEFPEANNGSVTTGLFQLVDQSGNPVIPTGPVSGITLGGEAAPGYTTPGKTTVDPLFDATDPTPGGGDTGSVLISPYIRPGSVSTTFYNHYSWLRTMEDIFDVSAGNSHSPIPGGAGSVSGGLDGLGHIGYAAQPGLAPFGPDVFNNPSGPGHHSHFPGPLQAGMPLVAVVGGGSYLLVRRRQNRRLAES